MTHKVYENQTKPDWSWLASGIGVIGTGVLTEIFNGDGNLFGAYCIGLALFFFLRLAIIPAIFPSWKPCNKPMPEPNKPEEG